MVEISDVDFFKMGAEFTHQVSYLGNGPVQNTIPDYIREKRMPIPGNLLFLLEGVEFEGNLEVDDQPIEFSLKFSMDQLEGEKACHENKILFITLLPRNGNEEERRYYFDVSEDGERRRAVYHPQWINFAKRYNEQQRQQWRKMLPPKK